MELQELDRKGLYLKARGLFGYSTNPPRFNPKPRTALTWKENVTEAEELGLQHSLHFYPISTQGLSGVDAQLAC